MTIAPTARSPSHHGSSPDSSVGSSGVIVFQMSGESSVEGAGIVIAQSSQSSTSSGVAETISGVDKK